MKNETHTIPDYDLMAGSEGEGVALLQAFLEKSGYLSCQNAVRGYFESTTKAALIRYQSDIGVEATGYFGLRTRAVMRGHVLILA